MTKSRHFITATDYFTSFATEENANNREII